MHCNFIPISVLVVSCICTFGCKDGQSERVPVSGTVTINGAPLNSGRIQFIPKNGRAANGVIDSQGHFSLSTLKEGDGCGMGSCRISVLAFEDVSKTSRRWDAPRKYADPSTSGLTEEISGPRSDVTIELKWDGKVGPIFERLSGGSE